MSGHGWVTPNPDGSKARCGGPAICPACAVEAGSKDGERIRTQVEAQRASVMTEQPVLTEADRIGIAAHQEMPGYGWCRACREDMPCLLRRMASLLGVAGLLVWVPVLWLHLIGHALSVVGLVA